MQWTNINMNEQIHACKYSGVCGNRDGAYLNYCINVYYLIYILQQKIKK